MKTMSGLILILVCGMQTSCVDTRDTPNFERMSREELAAYNQGRNIGQMIVCGEDERAFSRVRRRRCMTVEQMYGSAQQARQLDVLNTIPGYSE